MTALPQTTRRRLKKIPQIPSVWEGDRRPLGNMASSLESEIDMNGECIIWVDGSEGCVRAIDIVPPDTGLEAVVRTLLRAIESPHHPAQPARPQKVIVRDREIQFFLRGALQNLDIGIEYAPDLPLIDQLFRGAETIASSQPPTLPPLYKNLLQEIATEIWEEAPWELLADHDILTVKFSSGDVETVYICTIGMMSAEYGILLYRSLDSLKQFRAAALGDKSVAQLEQAFLAQDCWFLNFETEEELEEEEESDWLDVDTTEIIPCFGSLHPYEGMRPFLDEEEAKIVYVALEALLRFCQKYPQELEKDYIESLSENYTISVPKARHESETISVQIGTLPELTEELLALGSNRNLDLAQEERINIPIQEDLIPDGSLVTLESMPWELLTQIKHQKQTYYQSLDITPKGEGLPVIIVQTSRPKAKTLIEAIQRLGGIKAICFNPGNDPSTGETYDLGMLQTADGQLHIFAEYLQELPEDRLALQHWRTRCQKTHGYCGLLIAMGVTGIAKGNPQPRDMLALFEAKALQGKELGMGVLQLLPNFDFE
jgi:hypothetical protein